MKDPIKVKVNMKKSMFAVQHNLLQIDLNPLVAQFEKSRKLMH